MRNLQISSKNRMIKINTLITLLLMFFLTEYAFSQLSASNGIIYFRQQHLLADNNSALYWDSNNSDLTQLIFRDKENLNYGRVYGSGNGANFGLLDGDGHWSYLAAKDNYTAFRINNSEKMRIEDNGFVGIGIDNPLNKLHVNGTTRTGTIVVTQQNATGEGGEVQLLGSNGNPLWSIDNLNGKFRLHTGGNIPFTVLTDGKIGVNQTVPKSDLHIGQQLTFSSPHTNGGWGVISKNSYWDSDNKRVVQDEVAEMVFTDAGDILFRTAPTGPANSIIDPNEDYIHTMKILNGGGVNICGTIKANEVIVEEGWWCDFVFEDDYDLPTIEEQLASIEDNGHLANFQSEEEMSGNINLGDVTARPMSFS